MDSFKTLIIQEQNTLMHVARKHHWTTLLSPKTFWKLLLTVTVTVLTFLLQCKNTQRSLT